MSGCRVNLADYPSDGVTLPLLCRRQPLLTSEPVRVKALISEVTLLPKGLKGPAQSAWCLDWSWE